MVQAIQGLLLTCSDDSVKQIVLHLDSRHNFIVEDLDDTHVFIEPSKYEFVRSEVEKILSENMYVRDGESPLVPYES